MKKTTSRCNRKRPEKQGKGWTYEEAFRKEKRGEEGCDQSDPESSDDRDEEGEDDKDTSIGWETKDSGEEIEDNKDNKASKMARKKVMKNPLYRKNKED